MIARLIDQVEIRDTPQSVDAAYAAEVDWEHGYRSNPDSRLVLLGTHRLIERVRRVTGAGADTRRTGLVLGSHFGSMLSYEAVYASMAMKVANPLACTHALPSTPAAAVSIHFGLCGPTLTVSGEAEVGVTAVRNTLMLLAQGRCDTAIAGCWHMPSATAHAAGLPDRAELLLIALHRQAQGAQSGAGLDDFPAWTGVAEGCTCVDILADWLKHKRELLEPRPAPALEPS